MDTIKTSEKGNLIVISGTTCAGKGTVSKELLKRNDNIWRSVSYTSRSMRGGDIEGNEYYFITKEEFEKKIANDELLEYAIVHGKDYYGTPKLNIEEKLNSGIDVLLEIDIEGAKNIKEKFSDAILIFILAPSMEEVKRRIIARGLEDEQKIMDRFVSAYRELNEVTKYNYVVVNDEVMNAVSKIEAIIKAEKCRVDRIEEIYTGTLEEALHEELVSKNLINEERSID